MTPGGTRVVVASTGAGEQALQLLDAGTGRLISEIPVKKSWLGLALSPDGRTVYLAGANANAILVYRLESDRFVAAGELAVTTANDAGRDPIPAHLAVSPDGASLWVARVLADDVVRIDLETHAVSGPFPVGGHTYRPVFSPDGKRLAVSVWGGARVAFLDPATGRVEASVPTDDHPCDMVFSRDGRFLFVAEANRNRDEWGQVCFYVVRPIRS